MASTARLIAPIAVATCGIFRNRSAVRKVAASPMLACRNDTARRFSLIAQAKPRSAKTPIADWSCCIEDAAVRGLDPRSHTAFKRVEPHDGLQRNSGLPNSVL